MTKLSAGRGIAVTSAVVVTAAFAACTDDRDAQSRAAQGPVVVAAAPEATMTEPIVEVIDTPVIERTPVYENVSYEDAATAFRKGRYDESRAMLSVYVEEKPSNEYGHYLLGLSAWKTGDHEAAEVALTRAVELNGDVVKIRTNLGRVLLERGRAVDALPHIERAIELDSTSHEVWRVLGNVHAQLGSTDAALDAYRRALMLNERDAWTMNNYGLLLIQQGRFDEAMPPLARAVELVPGSATFRNNLGVALERIGELEGARIEFSAALEADSTYEKARTSLERVEARLVDTPMVAPDMTVFSQKFVDEMKSWTEVKEPEPESEPEPEPARTCLEYGC